MARPVPDRFRAQAEYIVWATNGPKEMTPTDKSVYLDGVFRVMTTPTEEREHATQKPVELMVKLTEVVLAGGTILDPFCGAGSTGVGCRLAGRNFIGIEIDAAYCEVSRRRIREAASLFDVITPNGP